MAEQLQAILYQDAALGLEDPGVNGQQLLMQPKRSFHITGQIRLNQLPGTSCAEMCRGADHPYGTDREQRQCHRIVAR